MCTSLSHTSQVSHASSISRCQVWSMLHLAWLGWRAYSQGYVPVQKKAFLKNRSTPSPRKRMNQGCLNTLNSVDQILSPSNIDREFGKTADLFERLLNNPAYLVHIRLPGCNSLHRTCISSLSTRMRYIIPQALRVHFPSTILRNQCC